ncbi:hypothetical protein EG328_008097 [Venturia inaequalis]|uniref:Uncharacterized protein n=1 Tax=Venturia inaequalis TaxID=5025 RepID=A0A8H3UDN4_VENIN|nr:hypothetical protein EG328_008097 [Venturia inaequalis]
MHSFALLSFAALATVAVGQNHYKHGPTFGWRRAKAAYVVSAETTLKPGPPPNPQVPRLAVWPGMDTSGGLIQPIIVSTSQKEYPQCKAGPTQHVRMVDRWLMAWVVLYNETLGGYEQWLYLKDEMVSYIGAKTGKARGFYTDTECQGAHMGVVSAHGSSISPFSPSIPLPSTTSSIPLDPSLTWFIAEYYDTKIVLSQADPTWGPNPSNHMMACADEITTSDNGKTWIVPTIKVSESVAHKDYNGKNPPGPIISW